MEWVKKWGQLNMVKTKKKYFWEDLLPKLNRFQEAVAQKIDKEIRKLVDEGYNQAKKILTEKSMIYTKLQKLL